MVVMVGQKMVTRIPVKVGVVDFPAGTEFVVVEVKTGGDVAARFPNGRIAIIKMFLELEEVEAPFDFNALLPLG